MVRISKEERKRIEDRITEFNDPTSEFRQRFDAAVAEWQQYFAPQIEALESATRLTAADYQIIVY